MRFRLIIQGVATLNEFREFFNMKHHETFADISKNPYIQNKLRDLYEHPDKVELYPGAFCESSLDPNNFNNLDPGQGPGFTLWGAIFADAITLVRSDRFYTLDWNVESLTAWGMKEVSPDNTVLKGSVFHRLMQRAFPGHFPYDNISLSNPFYTPQKNEEIAKAQKKIQNFDVRPVQVKPPVKIWVIKSFDNVTGILSASTVTKGVFASLASHTGVDIPAEVREAFNNWSKKSHALAAAAQKVENLQSALLGYFEDLTKDIIKRERIMVTLKNATKATKTNGSDPQFYPNRFGKIFQVDITRE